MVHNQVQNILEQNHVTPSPNSNVVFAQNWPANISLEFEREELLGALAQRGL